MKNKGFTLIELMVVVLIVAILAAVAIPLMVGRVDAAKWSEGKAGAGTVHTAARAYCAENGSAFTYPAAPTLTQLGFATNDLQGTYFTDASYAVSAFTYNNYTITVTPNASNGPSTPARMQMSVVNGAVTWTELGAP